MSLGNWHQRTLLFAVAVGFAACSHAGGGSFTPILPNNGFVLRGWQISGDGSTVVGGVVVGLTNHAFRWTAATGVVDLDPNSSLDSTATGVNFDGTVVSGNSNNLGTMLPTEGFRWSGGSFQAIGDFGLGGARASRVSDDGSVIAGSATIPGNNGLGRDALVWNTATGVTRLFNTGGHSQAHATDLSGDGSVVVGDYLGAFSWQAGTMTRFDTNAATANAISRDGTTIVGKEFTSDDAYIWNASSGHVTMGDFIATGVSGDGSVVVGRQIVSGNAHAVMWTRGGGLLDLTTSYSSLFPHGWSVFSAEDITADGQCILVQAVTNQGTYTSGILCPVPEPSTMTFCSLGLLAVLRRRRIKKTYELTDQLS